MDKSHFSLFLLTFILINNGVNCSSTNKKYNESCTPTESYYDDCNYYGETGKKCHPELRVCRCFNETSMFYDAEEETCFVKDFGAQCVYSLPFYKYIQCDRKSKLLCDGQTERCQCDWAYLPSTQNSSGNSETKCLPANEQVLCSDSMPCHESTGLVCAGGFCRCPRPLSQRFWSFDEKKCVGLPEAIDGCDPKQEGKTSQCVDNAYCGEDGKCHCKSGYSHEYGYASVCRLDYGQVCNMTAELGGGPYPSSCNYGRGFRCRDGICGCNDAPDTQYDPVQNACAITEGHFCQMSSYLPCLTGLECKPESNNDPLISTCQKMSDDTEEGSDESENRNQTNKESVILIFKMFK